MKVLFSQGNKKIENEYLIYSYAFYFSFTNKNCFKDKLFDSLKFIFLLTLLIL
jgi:hypothetical protein